MVPPEASTLVTAARDRHHHASQQLPLQHGQQQSRQTRSSPLLPTRSREPTSIARPCTSPDILLMPDGNANVLCRLWHLCAIMSQTPRSAFSITCSPVDSLQHQSTTPHTKHLDHCVDNLQCLLGSVDGCFPSRWRGASATLGWQTSWHPTGILVENV